MEVHHHPDLHHRKKDIREYFLEFIMIFLAVTLGFFAESLRESISNREKAGQYMHAMCADVIKDTIQLKEEVLYGQELSAGLDSLFLSLHSTALTDSVQYRLYFLNAKYNRLVGIIFSDEASSQLKIDGEMRLIQNIEVKDKITGYWKASQRLLENGDYFNNRMNNLVDDGYKIFDRIFILTYGRNLTDRSDMLDVSVRKDAKLMVTGTAYLIEYANKVKTLSNSLKMWYLPALLKQDDQAVSLIQLLEKKYPD